MSPFIHRFLLMLGMALLLAPAAGANPPEPRLQGNRIIDAVTEREFVPRGVNFPGFEYACQQGWDYGDDGSAPELADSTAAAIADWGINTVRLPLNQDCWLGEDGLPAGDLTMSGYRNSVVGFVEALNRAGLVVIVDLHWSGPTGVIADGLRPMPDNRSPAFWHSVASRFKQNRSVIFDLFNEPHSRWNPDDSWVFGLSWDCWSRGGCQVPAEPDTAPLSGGSWFAATGMARLVRAVRNVGATQPILLSGIDYANDLRGWLAGAPDDDQLIAGFHNYPVQRCRTAACWDSEIAPLAGRVPVLAAEIGQNDCGYPGHVRRFLDWADRNTVGYLVWAWWALPDLGCRNFALVSDLDGTPLPPVGTALHDHLASLAENPEPARRASGLRIGFATWNRRRLRLGARMNPLASRAVRVTVTLRRDRRAGVRPRARTRLIQRRMPIDAGRGRLTALIPAGLRPKTVTLYYPGDTRLAPGRVRGRPGSVSKLTRPARRR